MQLSPTECSQIIDSKALDPMDDTRREQVTRSMAALHGLVHTLEAAKGMAVSSPALLLVDLSAWLAFLDGVGCTRDQMLQILYQVKPLAA